MSEDGLVFVPLGGAGEIGMNVNMYGLDGRWMMVDLGISFADDRLPGTDIVLPNIAFAEERKRKLDGLVLTHAHEDHYGAVGYLWERLGVPVWCTPFTAAMLRHKLQEARLVGKVKINEVRPGEPFTVGPFACHFVRMAHSIPESSALAIETPHGTVVHTGDWKLDPEPPLGYRTDKTALETLGDKGVLALVGDSTNILNPGASGSEAEVRDSLVELIAAQKQRVLVTTFASNVARLSSVMHAARKAGREIVVAGRSMNRVIAAAKESGYLKDMPDTVPDRQAGDLPPARALVLCTGCQGEERAALGRIASGQHPFVDVDPGDTVIFSSKIIPGNERILYNLHNQLVRLGVEVITEDDHFVHVSGHPCRDEVEQLYRWVRPKIAVPVHGEPRHLEEHVRFARQQGVPTTLRVDNGDVVRLAPGEPARIDAVTAGRFAVETPASFLREDDELFRTRRRLTHNGTVVVSLVMDEVGSLVADPKISAIGALHLGDDGAQKRRAIEAVVEAVEDLDDRQAVADERVAETVRGAVRRGFELARERRPIIEVQITRLTQDVLGALEGGGNA